MSSAFVDGAFRESEVGGDARAVLFVFRFHGHGAELELPALLWKQGRELREGGLAIVLLKFCQVREPQHHSPKTHKRGDLEEFSLDL